MASRLVPGLFRNPLVSPDILGASSGAALNAVLGIYYDRRVGVLGKHGDDLYAGIGGRIGLIDDAERRLGPRVTGGPAQEPSTMGEHVGNKLRFAPRIPPDRLQRSRKACTVALAACCASGRRSSEARGTCIYACEVYTFIRERLERAEGFGQCRRAAVGLPQLVRRAWTQAAQRAPPRGGLAGSWLRKMENQRAHINAVRAHLAEIGLVASAGIDGMRSLLAIVREADEGGELPAPMRQALQALTARSTAGPDRPTRAQHSRAAQCE